MIPFRKSLAFRVLSSFIILLCLPVLVDSFVLLNQSFKEGEEQAHRTLKKISTQREWSLIEIVSSSKPVTRLIENHLELQKNFPASSSEELNNKLAELAHMGGFSEIILLKATPEKKFFVLSSSLGKNIDQEASTYIESIPQSHEGFNFIFIKGKKKYLFVNALNIYDEEGSLLGALLVYSDISEKLNAFLEPDLANNPIFFALLLENSLVFAASDSQFGMNYFVPLSKESKKQWESRLKQIREGDIDINDLRPKELEIKKGSHFPFFIFTWKQEEWLSYLSRIGNSHYYLLSYTSKKELYADIIFDFLQVYGGYIVILFLGSWLSFLLMRRLSKPLSDLTETMKLIQEGKYETHAHYDRWGFEINTLSTTFNDVIETLVYNEKVIEEVRLKAELYKKELSLGEEVQRRLYDIEKPTPEIVDLSTRYIPSQEVGGDFCDHFIQDDRLVLMIADAAGKGVEACFYSLIVRNLIRILSQEKKDVSLVIEKTNELFLKDVEENGVFVTAILAFFDPLSKKLSYYCSGHNPAFIRHRDGSIEILKKQGAALGIEQTISKTQIEEIYLEQGDIVIFYTDGITEAHNLKKELFTEERLIKIVLEEDKLTASELCHKIIERIREFEEGAWQHDDITLMVMRIKDV